MTMVAAALMTGYTSNSPADTLNLSPEQRAQNMQEAHDFVKECGYYTIATARYFTFPGPMEVKRNNF